MFEYIYLHLCAHLPESLCITPINPPALEHWESYVLPSAETDEMCSSPAASINPSKMDAASSTAAGPPGKLRRCDCSGSTGTAGAPGGTQGCSTSLASMLREILGPRPEEDLRGRHRSRLFETTSTLGEEHGDGRYSSQCVWKGTRLQYFNMGKAAADLLREGRSRQESLLWRNQDFLKQIFRFFSRAEARSEFVPSSCSCHAAPTKLTPSSARYVSHPGRVSPSFPSPPHGVTPSQRVGQIWSVQTI